MDFREAVKRMRRTTFEETKQITLGGLIDLLKNLQTDEDCYVRYSFPNKFPTECDSYRGSYDELAIGHDSLDWDKRPMLSVFLKHLQQCVGKTFFGWKGGEFEMDRDTPVWVDNPGECSSCGVVGITPIYGANDRVYEVIINTDYCEF